MVHEKADRVACVLAEATAVNRQRADRIVIKKRHNPSALDIG
jgi:hypothetical protein